MLLFQLLINMLIQKFSSERDVVENTLGKLCSLWSLSFHKWRLNEVSYDTFFKIAIALTIFHVKIFPL